MQNYKYSFYLGSSDLQNNFLLCVYQHQTKIISCNVTDLLIFRRIPSYVPNLFQFQVLPICPTATSYTTHAKHALLCQWSISPLLEHKESNCKHFHYNFTGYCFQGKYIISQVKSINYSYHRSEVLLAVNMKITIYGTSYLHLQGGRVRHAGKVRYSELLKAEVVYINLLCS
jgi:hypothetical protein